MLVVGLCSVGGGVVWFWWWGGVVLVVGWCFEND